MAIAAADFDIIETAYLGVNMKMVVGTYTPSGTYTSGGEVLTNAIAKRGLGLKEIHVLDFTPLVDHDAASLIVHNVVFDHVGTSTTQGKIRAVTSGSPAHLHSFLVKGGQAAAGTDAISIKGGPVVIGKEAATDATALGGATNGGVLNSSIVEGATEVAAGTNLTAYKARFIAIGA